LIWITGAIRNVTDEEAAMTDKPSQLSDSPNVDLPGTAGQVAKEKPELWRAFQQLGAATGAAGPLSEREQRLVNLALALGGDSEGATHSHARRGLADGLSAEELEHVAFLAITTLGWPQAIRGLTWVRDVTKR
jgi:alkylhydroperoxidase/carboxymuconolactone decarboxylase family protein YurZ